MKSKHYLLSVTMLALVYLLPSCKKTEKAPEEKPRLDIGKLVSEYLIAREKPTDGIISITARSTPSMKKNGQAPDIMIDAQFYQNKNMLTPFYAGDLTIGEFSIPFFNKRDGSPSGYNLQTNVNVDKTMLARFLGLWGTKVHINLTPPAYGSVALNSTFPSLSKPRLHDLDQNGFYIPAMLEMQSDFISNGNYAVTVNNSSNIYWNPDPNNPSGTIMIGIIQEGNTYDPNNPVPTEVVFFREIPDIGYYSLSPSDLSALTTGGYASVFIARGNYGVFTDSFSSNQVLIEAMTYSNLAFLGVN